MSCSLQLHLALIQSMCIWFAHIYYATDRRSARNTPSDLLMEKLSFWSCMFFLAYTAYFPRHIADMYMLSVFPRVCDSESFRVGVVVCLMTIDPQLLAHLFHSVSPYVLTLHFVVVVVIIIIINKIQEVQILGEQ